jgi:hypothetical protein
MIKKYSEFIVENYFPDNTDSPEIASDMNGFNDISDQIKEFDTKKVTINNIYMTYTDEKDLINKLSSQKFIDNTSDKKSIKFHNSILGMWAQSCEKRRDLKEIDDQIKKWQEDIKNEESNLKSNPSSKDTVDANIKLTQDKIKEKTQEVSKKQMEIANLEKLAKDKLKALSGELGLSKKRLDMYRANKFAKK